MFACCERLEGDMRQLVHLRGCRGHRVVVIVEDNVVRSIKTTCDLVAINTEIALGGIGTPCHRRVEQLKHALCFRGVNIGRWPKGLCDAYAHINRVRYERIECAARTELAKRDDCLPLVERARRRIQSAIWTSLPQMSSAYPLDSMMNPMVRVELGHANVAGTADGWCLTVPVGWLHMVRRRLSVVDGRLILGVYEFPLETRSYAYYLVVDASGRPDRRNGWLTMHRGVWHLR